MGTESGVPYHISTEKHSWAQNKGVRLNSGEDMYFVFWELPLIAHSPSHLNADSGYNPVHRISVLYERRDEDGCYLRLATGWFATDIFGRLLSRSRLTTTASTRIARFVCMQF